MCCAVTLLTLFFSELAGVWQPTPLDIFGNDFPKFERGLLGKPLIGDELQKLGCSGEYIQGASINLLDTEEMVLDVLCNDRKIWIYMENMPPTKVETFYDDPTL